MNPEPVHGVERETLAEATCRLRTALAAENPPAAVQHAMRGAFAAAMPARAAPAQPGVATNPVLAPAKPPSPGPAHADAIAPAARRGARRPARTGRRWWAAAACASVLAASLTLLLLAAPDERSGNTTAAPEPAFVPVAAAERWPSVGSNGGAAAWLVAAEMPRERLAEWGLPFDPSRAGEPVRAELLLRPSGEVLAVRVLHNPTAR